MWLYWRQGCRQKGKAQGNSEKIDYHYSCFRDNTCFVCPTLHTIHRHCPSIRTILGKWYKISNKNHFPAVLWDFTSRRAFKHSSTQKCAGLLQCRAGQSCKILLPNRVGCEIKDLIWLIGCNLDLQQLNCLWILTTSCQNVLFLFFF